MRQSFRLILLLLAFGLLVQNTCPHGFAGKTSLSSCGHCPLRQVHVPASNAQPGILSDASSLHFPFFVFSVPKASPVIAPEPALCEKPGPANSYADASPRELLRPPQA